MTDQKILTKSCGYSYG